MKLRQGCTSAARTDGQPLGGGVLEFQRAKAMAFGEAAQTARLRALRAETGVEYRPVFARRKADVAVDCMVRS